MLDSKAMAEQNEKEYYVSPKEFKLEVDEFFLDKTKEWPQDLPVSIVEKIEAIINGLSRRQEFSGYTYLEDMKSHALILIMQYGKNYDPTKGFNPFSYFNTIAWNAFLQIIKKEQKQQEIKDRSLWNLILTDPNLRLDDSGEYEDTLNTLIQYADEK